MPTNSKDYLTLNSDTEHGGLPTYVLITPARNEAALIELTIQSMMRQTVKPIKWVIVSDGSTDGTDDIVRQYCAKYDWMGLVRMPEHSERNFAAKVHAFNAGYARVQDLEYDIIGNLDADISFAEDYFSFLLMKFAENPQLGVGGTPFSEESHQYDYRFANIEHVSGACQLFRRDCFESIGGYKPLKSGGIDWAAVTTARMIGWKTQTFTEKVCTHHRKIGTGGGTNLSARFRFGKQDYFLGGHPLWEIFRSIYQMKNRPYILGGLFLFSGYLCASLSRADISIPPDLAKFRRKEQMQRLKQIIVGAIRKAFCKLA